MDLFDDLPAPNDDEKPELPRAKRTPQPLQNSPSLFDDLPAMTSENSSRSTNPQAASPNTNKRKVEEHDENNKGQKRVHTENSSGDSGGSTVLSLKGYFANRKGEREDMQDAHIILDNFTTQITGLHPSVERLSYYAVFDGHGGHRASQYAAEHLHTLLAERFPKGDLTQVEKEIKKCFIEAFKKTDEAFLKEATKKKPSWKDGTTATCVLTINNTLYIANLGDSKAILCRYNESLGKWTPLALTKDHTPTLYEERMRIQKAGGAVRDGRVMGVLEVSRSIGDGPYKSHGVCCVPDVKRCQLTKDDRFLLIACDGLWKTFDSAGTLAFVNKILDDARIPATESKTAQDIKYETACNQLANEAVRRLSADNVTVLLVAVGNQKSKKAT